MSEKMKTKDEIREEVRSETSRLKTLKDFNYLYETATVDDLRNQLRKEAIAHVLQIQAMIKEKEGKWDDLGLDEGMAYEEQGNAMIAWITFFFNLTDEDLVIDTEKEQKDAYQIDSTIGEESLIASYPFKKQMDKKTKWLNK